MTHWPFSSVCVFLASLVVAMPAPSTAADPCATYYGKGYCTDYIQQRLGSRPSGDAGTWPANIELKDVRQGDVAIFRSKNHVAYIEQIIARDSHGVPSTIKISEMNWGKGLMPGTPPECIITVKFGIRTERTISVTGLEYWRATYKNILNVEQVDMRNANSTPAVMPKKSERSKKRRLNLW